MDVDGERESDEPVGGPARRYGRRVERAERTGLLHVAVGQRGRTHVAADAAGKESTPAHR